MIKMHNRHTTGPDRFVIAKDKETANDEPQMQPLVSRLIGWANPRRRFISTLHFTCGDVTSAQWWQHGHWSIAASLLTSETCAGLNGLRIAIKKTDQWSQFNHEKYNSWYICNNNAKYITANKDGFKLKRSWCTWPQRCLIIHFRPKPNSAHV